MSDQDYNLPGETIRIPWSCSEQGKFHTVVPGDTIVDIAKDYNVNLDCLLSKDNPLADSSPVDPGDCVSIPKDCPPYFNGGAVPTSTDSVSTWTTVTRTKVNQPFAIATRIDINDSDTGRATEEIVLGSSTYLPGPNAQTIIENGKTLLLGGSAGLVVGSQTISLPGTGNGILTSDGITVSFSHIPVSRTIVVDGKTITLNETETTITEPFSGPTVIFEPSDIVIGSDTLHIRRK